MVFVKWRIAEFRFELDLLVRRERLGVAIDPVEIGIARQHHRAVGKALDRRVLQKRAIGGEGVVGEGLGHCADVEIALEQFGRGERLTQNGAGAEQTHARRATTDDLSGQSDSSPSWAASWPPR